MNALHRILFRVIRRFTIGDYPIAIIRSKPRFVSEEPARRLGQAFCLAFISHVFHIAAVGSGSDDWPKTYRQPAAVRT